MMSSTESTTNAEITSESIEVAVASINSDLKEPVYKKFLSYATSILCGYAQPNTASKELCMSCAGSFLVKVFERSSEDEKSVLAKIIQNEHMMLRKVFDVICLIWTKEISLSKKSYEDIHALLGLFLHSCKYILFKENIQLCVEVVNSLSIYFEDAGMDIFKDMDSIVYKLLQDCLEFMCLFIDHSSSATVQYVESKCSQLTQKLCNSPNHIICLLAKVVSGLLSVKGQNVEHTSMNLNDEELECLLDMLKPEYDSSLCVSESIILSLLRGLTVTNHNRDRLQESDFESLLLKNPKWSTYSWIFQEFSLKQNCEVTESEEERAASSLTHESQSELSKESHSKELLSLESVLKVSDLTVHDESGNGDTSVVEVVDFLAKFLVKLVSRLNSSEEPPLYSAEFDNCTASLLLIEQLKSEANEKQDKEINHSLSQIPCFAKTASLLLEHMNDPGTSEVFRRCVLRTVVCLMMELTDYSQEVCIELSMTGFIAYLLAFLDKVDKTAIFEEGMITLVILILTIILNCAKESSTLQIFEAANAAQIILPYVECPIFNISILGKIVLGFLKSHLKNDQFMYLELDPEETTYLVTLFSEAVESPSLRAEGNSIDEILQFLINFTQPCGKSTEEMKKQDESHSKKASQFSLEYRKQMELSYNNIQVAVAFGILSSIEKLLNRKGLGPQQTDKCLHLLWNLLHLNSIVNDLSSSFRESLHNLPDQISANPDTKALILCIQWLLGEIDKNDISLGILYAKACYKYSNFEECVSICCDMKKLLSSGKKNSQAAHEINLIYGKAVYYTSQPELWLLIKERDSLTEKEIRLVSNECNKKMKEAITCLGSALDERQIDSEGSKLLDFALNASALDLGYLGTRCLLCRRGGQKLKNSHLWPNSILERIYKAEYRGTTKPFLFGKNINQPKFGRQCTFYMFCYRCEELLSQNGEDQFAKLLDHLQRAPGDTHTYDSWLYSFAIGIVFRELATEAMSYVVNEQELYNAFLLCRKHLFTLSAKIDKKYLPTYAEEEGYQFQSICAYTTGCSDLSVYIMNCMAKQASSKDKMIHYYSEYCHCSGSVATCRLSDAKLDLSGRVHFLQVYLNGIHFLVKFKASENCPIDERFLILPQPTSTQRSVIPVEDVNSIPEGVWSVLRHTGSISFDLRMRCYQAISDLTLCNLTESDSQLHNSTSAVMTNSTLLPSQPIDPTSEVDILTDSIRNSGASMLSLPSLCMFNLLPKSFSINVNKPGELPLCLPDEHKVILHLSGQLGELLASYFLCMDSSVDSQNFYIIFVYSDDANSDLQIADGVNITAEDEPVVSSFLLNDRPRMESLPHPFSIPVMQEMIDQQLPSLLYSKGIKSMKHLMHLLDCRRLNKSLTSAMESIPALDTKCQPACCWYCENLCHCCMYPVPLWASEAPSLSPGPEEPLTKFCGENCQELLHPKPGSPPKVSVTFNKKKPGKIVGPAKLQITKSLLPSGAKFSKLEYIELCIADGCGVTPVGVPYVLWQLRSINSQSFMDFTINDKFEPLECLWMSRNAQLNISLDDSPVKIQICRLLQNVLALILEKLGYKCLGSFVADNLPEV